MLLFKPDNDEIFPFPNLTRKMFNSDAVYMSFYIIAHV